MRCTCGREHPVLDRVHDVCFRVALADLTHHLDAFHHRHPQIEQRHVRTMAVVCAKRIDAIAGFGNHMWVWFVVEPRPRGRLTTSMR